MRVVGSQVFTSINCHISISYTSMHRCVHNGSIAQFEHRTMKVFLSPGRFRYSIHRSMRMLNFQFFEPFSSFPFDKNQPKNVVKEKEREREKEREESWNDDDDTQVLLTFSLCIAHLFLCWRLIFMTIIFSFLGFIQLTWILLLLPMAPSQPQPLPP